MDAQNIMSELRNFIKEQFKIPEKDPDFSDDVHLFDFGYIDSFGAVKLISFVETKFSIKISERDLVAYSLNTIREISNFVITRKKGEI